MSDDERTLLAGVADPCARALIEYLLARVSKLEADAEEQEFARSRERRRYNLTRRCTDVTT